MDTLTFLGLLCLTCASAASTAWMRAELLWLKKHNALLKHATTRALSMISSHQAYEKQADVLLRTALRGYYMDGTHFSDGPSN